MIREQNPGDNNGYRQNRMRQNTKDTIRMEQHITKSNSTEQNRKNNMEPKQMETNQMKQNSQEKETKDNKGSGKMTPKRIAALLGVILLVALYLITLIVAIVDKSASGTWFMLCLIGTVTIPLLIWIYTWMYGVLTNRRTIATIGPEHRDNTETAESNSQGMPSEEAKFRAASDK